MRIVATVEHGVPLMKASKTRSEDRRWATPSPPEDGQGTLGPQKGVGGLQVQPLSGALLNPRELLGSVVLQAAGLPPGASSVLKRIRTPA